MESSTHVPFAVGKKFSDDVSDEDVDWELIVDNNSGTYSPDPKLLPNLRALLEYNFVGLRIRALDHSDSQLEQSREACRAYAMKKPWSKKGGTSATRR